MEKSVDTHLCCTGRNSTYYVFVKQFCVLFLFDEESFKTAVLPLSIDGEWLGNARQIWPIRGQRHTLQTPGSSVTVETEVLCLGKSRLPHILQAVCHTPLKTSSKTVLNCPTCKLEVITQRYLARVLPQAVHMKRIGPVLFHVALLQPTNLSTGGGQHMLQNKNNTGRGLWFRNAALFNLYEIQDII